MQYDRMRCWPTTVDNRVSISRLNTDYLFTALNGPLLDINLSSETMEWKRRVGTVFVSRFLLYTAIFTSLVAIYDA